MLQTIVSATGSLIPYKIQGDDKEDDEVAAAVAAIGEGQDWSGSIWILHALVYHRKISQINDMKLMWEEIGDGVCKWYCFYSYSYSMIDITPTPTPTNKEAFNGRRHTDKYVSVSTGGLSCPLHIQFFSQNQSLFSLIENQTISQCAWCALDVHRIFRVLLVVLLFVF